MNHLTSTIPLLACRTLFLALALFGGQSVAAQPGPPAEQAGQQQQLQVNVNEADAETLADVLVGIGASRARAIVEYREEHGRFSTLEDLTQVTGVGEATVMNNRDRIRFE
jgi:competence protein ComEA